MIKSSHKILILTLISLFLFGFFAFDFSLAQSDYELDREIEALNLQIQIQKKEIDKLLEKQNQYQAQIKAKQQEKVSLNNQLGILDDSLAKTELEIEAISLEIAKLNLEIQKVELDMSSLDLKINNQKEQIIGLLRLIYKQDKISTIEALLLNDNLSDFLSQLKYLRKTNDKLSSSINELKVQKNKLEQNKLSLEEKDKEAKTLKEKLEEKKDSLNYEQGQKEIILIQTLESEEAFQALLARVKAEQNQVKAEISQAENLIRQKMSQKDKDLLDSSDSTLAWPVPKNYITATFHDPDYPFRTTIGEHPAIDIRAAQGTELRAAADGYVAKVVFDGSKDYAYIMLIHGNDLATVYGHVSAVNVSLDQFVLKGQLIGRTGGMPGGPGSGAFSTGPHLHFEVRKSGLPVNPLNYLP